MIKAYRGITVNCASLFAIALVSQVSPAFAASSAQPVTAWDASRETDDSDMVTTGVARGRDRLDSATSTSSLKGNQIDTLAPRSLDDLVRNIPGVRVEGGVGDIGNSYTVRGLPLVSAGAKYLQFQEDGLPVLEFGDFNGIGADAFIRADLNLASVESIRGGSASTFTSNAPGGIINLVSKTGEVEGGSVQVSAGVNYDSNRVDFDYGGHLSESWRFHVGGFYRQGEGSRNTGYNATDGGQVKFNVTKTFEGGHIRFYGKLLDDKTPVYNGTPMAIGGTNANPTYGALANYDAVEDSVMSRNITGLTTTDESGNPTNLNLQSGYRVKSQSLGTEVQFSVGEWNFTERFRFSDMSGFADTFDPQTQIAASCFLSTACLNRTGTNSTVTYASGPLAGTAIAPATRLSLTTVGHTDIHSLRNVVNDFRTSRVWEVGGGDLTTTAGVYKSFQKRDVDYFGAVIIQTLDGNGNSALVNVQRTGGAYSYKNGIFAHNDAVNGRTRMNLDYDVLAPYASFNFHKGKIAIGGSIRYDRDKVTGLVARPSTNAAVDLDHDGQINLAEQTVYIDAGTSSSVNYRNDYVSYSGGINYRMSDSFALFARHSLGGRADANEVSPTHDYVRQTEAGVKYRSNGITLNLTGFYATTRGTFAPTIADTYDVKNVRVVSRSYRTYGAEFEGAVRRGPFSVTASATLTGGEITASTAPAPSSTGAPFLPIGTTPRRQPTFLYTLTPQFDVERVTFGANVQGQTSSYAGDVDQLKMPGFTTVGLFAQYRPVDRIALGVNVSNLFDKTAIIAVGTGTIPSAGVGTVQTLYGRLISASARFFF
ncbi:MAG TPA: TonB-dependent receptor [Sphingobium sp.]